MILFISNVTKRGKTNEWFPAEREGRKEWRESQETLRVTDTFTFPILVVV